jgi:hypothetical protein
MNEELFERYLRNDLDEAGARELGALLESKEGSAAFVAFVQEWTLLGEAASQRVAETGREGTRKIRKIRPTAASPSRSAIGWAVGIAAALLFMLGLVLSNRPDREPRPVATKIVPPAPPPIVEPGPKPELPPRESAPTPRSPRRFPLARRRRSPRSPRSPRPQRRSRARLPNGPSRSPRASRWPTSRVSRAAASC